VKGELAVKIYGADLRLLDIGHRVGLINDADLSHFNVYRQAVVELSKDKNALLPDKDSIFPWTHEQINFETEVTAKYAGYINRQSATAERMQRMDGKRIPENFNYDSLRNLLTEARQKLKLVRPGTLGQASRIPGVTPSDVAILMIHLNKR